jgi:hypothetical protein
MEPAPNEVTQLLQDWSGGDQTALDKLMLEREGDQCNSMELSGMGSTLPHLKDSRERLLDLLNGPQVGGALCRGNCGF